MKQQCHASHWSQWEQSQQRCPAVVRSATDTRPVHCGAGPRLDHHFTQSRFSRKSNVILIDEMQAFHWTFLKEKRFLRRNSACVTDVLRMGLFNNYINNYLFMSVPQELRMILFHGTQFVESYTSLCSWSNKTDPNHDSTTTMFMLSQCITILIENRIQFWCHSFTKPFSY